MTIFIDSKRVIQTMKSEKVTAQNKHFDIQLFKLHKVQQGGIIDFTFIPSMNNATDGLTQALVEITHYCFLKMIAIQL
ncbi:hypothetical protein L873DRAFT_1801543 [Choiromyces venosus 120613-1]|uniref:RNase H type-1 domain-containing protein n=1 Tax=Choiromyces venosus 120613-1 TaxID=1336337 RepID=A0A3N4KAF7_9PEZI|nr:hypothetical protein L873DRAFT_1801543 [Choiromyces venosus 120613-1]